MLRRARLLAAALTVLVFAMSAPVASAATAPAYGLHILSSTSYVDGLGDSHVVGEVKNDTIFAVEFVKVTADFFDAADNLLTTGFAYAALFTLDPGEKSNFDVVGHILSAVTYDLRLTYDITNIAANHNFTVTVTSAETDADGITHFAGTIKNNNTTKATFVRAEITLYDASGKPVGEAFEYVDGDEPYPLNAGETKPFQTMFFDNVGWTTYAAIGDSSTSPTLPVTLTVSPSTPIYGSLVKLSGVAAAGTAVTIQRWDRANGWITLASTTAAANRTYAVNAKILTTWFIRANTAAGPSVARSLTQRSLITLTSNLTSVRKNAIVTLSGIVRPVYAGKKVAIQQLIPPNWRTIGYATLTSSSAYTYRYTAKTLGTIQLRATIDDQADSTTNVTSVRRITVRP